MCYNLAYMENTKDFDKWNKLKKQIDTKDFNGRVHEREIWWANLGLNIGHEEDGKNNSFQRPVLIIKKWSSKTVIVLPLTTKIKNNKYHYIFEHHNIRFGVILSQVRLISTNRLTRRIRKIGNGLFNNITLATKNLLFS